MIKAPYNFVPLSDKVYFPEWADAVSQDVPFEDGEDGIVEVNINNISPLFTRNGHARNIEEQYSSHVCMQDGRRRYFIPATTIKGCIRSVMEILSFAKMGPFNNDSFGMPRAFDTKQSANKPYLNAIKHTMCGWLKQKDDAYVIIPCTKGIQEISHDKLTEHFPAFNRGEDHNSAQCKQESISCNGRLFPELEVIADTIKYKVSGNTKWVPEGRYSVVCTGYMNGKNHEYLFSLEQGDEIIVSDEVFRAFESVHQRTEYYGGRNGENGFLKKRLHSGKEIPVFFVAEGKDIKAIGITKMLRYPYTYSVKDAVANSRIVPIDENKPDLPETIFGYTKGHMSLRGRVQVGHAFCNSNIDDEHLLRISGVLGGPSASYYPLYLQPGNGKYNSYADKGVQIAGRKRYRITSGHETLSLPIGNENERVMTHFNAIPQGQTFRCRIALHNLRKLEIGALLSSLTMGNTPNTYHNIGMAKSFGFGKIKCDVTLSGLQYSVEEYIRAFEMELMERGFNVTNNSSLNTLVAIASEHSADDMQMMSLDEYTENKKNSNFSMLKENSSKFHTYSTYEDIEKKREAEAEVQKERIEKDKKIEEARHDVELAEKLMSQKLWKQATGMLRSTIDTLVALGEDVSKEELLLHTCQQENAKSSKTSLSSALEGIGKIGTIAGRVKIWCKDNPFDEKALVELVAAIMSLQEKEKKGLKGKRKDFVKAIGENGESWTDKLFAECGI
ncbi:MAG: TIGR03986 family CRISPR-associated RAMP protein [Bacteroidaceae bacterium]|nr:TIGR03986 family CRISPR-associated RAMP protein [Bacteroidaceae bacterium]